MRVNQVVQNEDKTYSFDGTLSEEEHELVLTVGLNFLYAEGLLANMTPDVEVTELDGTETVN